MKNANINVYMNVYIYVCVYIVYEWDYSNIIVHCQCQNMHEAPTERQFGRTSKKASRNEVNSKSSARHNHNVCLICFNIIPYLYLYVYIWNIFNILHLFTNINALVQQILLEHYHHHFFFKDGFEFSNKIQKKKLITTRK